MLREIEQNLFNVEQMEAHPEFVRFLEESQKQEICRFTNDPVLGLMEEYCTLSTIHQNREKRLKAKIQAAQESLQQAYNDLKKDVENTLTMLELRRKEEADRLEEEARKAKEAEDQKAAQAQEGQEGAPAGEEGEALDRAKSAPQFAEVLSPPRSQPGRAIIDEDESNLAQIKELKGDFSELNPQILSLDSVERERIFSSDLYKEFERREKELEVIREEEVRYNRLMEGIETLAKGDLQEVHRAFMDSNDGNMYKQPLNNVYQSVNNRLSETVKELHHKLEKFTDIDKENAALGTEVGYMKQTLDVVVKERDQLASELKNLEDQRYNIDQAKENERKVVQLREEVEALEAKYNAEKAKNQDLDSRFKREVDEFYAKRNLVEVQRTELEREKRATDEKHKEEKKRLDSLFRELEDKKLELTKKEELLTSKIKDQDTHNRRIRYSRSNSPIGASKSPRLFNSTFQGSEIRDGVNASRDYRDVPSGTLPMNSFARDDIASFPQIGAIQDVRGGSDLSQRAREAAGNESRLDESHLDDIRQDLTAQRKEVKLEREALKREKEEFQTERARVLKELGEVETLKSRIKALEQENQRLKQSLEASQGQSGGALFRLPNVFAVLVLGLAVLSLGFGFGNNWQMLK